MASGAEEAIYKIFADLLAGGSGQDIANLNGPGLAAAITSAVPASAQATGSAAPSRPLESGGIAETAETVAMDVLKSGFGLVPLVGSLFGLFGGGGEPAPPPLTKYALPPRRSFAASETSDGQLVSVDYDQSGRPRAADAAVSGFPPVQVNVQALDARSFLDRSSEIAAAVRDAMLHLNPINDVVNDL